MSPYKVEVHNLDSNGNNRVTTAIVNLKSPEKAIKVARWVDERRSEGIDEVDEKSEIFVVGSDESILWSSTLEPSKKGGRS